jgi:CTP:molybdopterin cytidylyltransferase MocA
MDEPKIMPKEKIAALILAAGRSTRMGTFKPLMPLGSQTVLERLINLYRSAGISDMLVVLGHQAADALGVLKKQGISWTINEQYDQGMFSSIQAGVKNLHPDCKVFFLHPADIPLVRPETINRLIDIRCEKKASIYYPRHEGRRGHPPLISAALIPAVLAFDEPGGMRALLSRYNGEALNIDCHDPGILMDIDTPEHYEKALRTFSSAE